MKKNVIILLLAIPFLFFYSNGVYAQEWVSIDGEKQGKGISVDIIQSDASIYQARITIHGFLDRIISKNGIDYHRITMDEGVGLMTVGEPQLPTISWVFAIPEGAKYDFSLTEVEWKEVEIGKIFPTQENSKNIDIEPDFLINEAIYCQEVYEPVFFQLGAEQNWRNIRNVSTHICPFKYYPRRNKLSVLKEFVFTLKFTNVSDKSLVRRKDLEKAAMWHMFDNDIKDFPVRNSLVNAPKTSTDYDYLIIVGDIPSILNSQALQDFKNWKAIKGFSTKIVSTTTIGTTQDDIKNYILQEYNTCGIDYVLFIGDHDKIPLKTLYIVTESGFETAHGDYWYGCLNGLYDDYFAEIPIGRFSTNTLSEFQNMVNKTITYERSYNVDSKKALLVAHKQNPTNATFFQRCSEAINNALFTYPLSFSTAYGALSAKNSDVINYINNGMNIVNYKGHGNSCSWLTWNNDNESFGSSAIDSIDNTSIFFNVCCKTGNIIEEPCMMEKLTRSSKGATACLAATDSTWRHQGNTYNQKLFTLLLNDSCSHIGNMNILSHIATITYFSNENLYRNEAIHDAWSYLCGGDPTLEIWTDGPFSLDHNNVIVSESNGVMTICTPSLTSSKLIVLSESFDVIGSYNVSGNTCSFNIPSGDFYVSINSYNYFPYLMLFSSSNHLQNKTVYANSHYRYRTTPFNIGYDVTNSVPYGNVILKSGSKVSINNGSGGVTIKNGFECEKGAELVIE